MPPYPFSPRPRFADFKNRLVSEYQCELKVIGFNVNDEFRNVPFLEREVGNRTLRAVVIFEEDDIVEFSDIRRICRAIEVPPAAFGLDLEGWYDADDPDQSDAIN